MDDDQSIDITILQHDDEERRTYNTLLVPMDSSWNCSAETVGVVCVRWQILYERTWTM